MPMPQTLSDVDLTPTPEMQAAAKAGLSKLASGGSAVPQGVQDRAKRIARGVPLEEHQVHGIDREHQSMLGGQTIGGNLAGDAHAQQDVEHLLRGGSAGADWAADKVAELSTIREPGSSSTPSSAQQGKDSGDEGGGAMGASIRFDGMSLAESRDARRHLKLALDFGKRNSTFEAADSTRRAARHLGSLRPDDSPVMQAEKLAKASMEIHAASGQLPNGHPQSGAVGNACTAIDNCVGYPIDGLDHSVDAVADRILTLDPDFDGDNDLGSGDTDGSGGEPFADSSLPTTLGASDLREYADQGSTKTDLDLAWSPEAEAARWGEHVKAGDAAIAAEHLRDQADREEEGPDSDTMPAVLRSVADKVAAGKHSELSKHASDLASGVLNDRADREEQGPNPEIGARLRNVADTLEKKGAGNA